MDIYPITNPSEGNPGYMIMRGALEGKKKKQRTRRTLQKEELQFLMMWELAMGEDYWGLQEVHGYLALHPRHRLQVCSLLRTVVTYTAAFFFWMINPIS